jgi:hypothetical protein
VVRTGAVDEGKELREVKEDAMAESVPAIEGWRSLYQAATRLKEASPWQWMEEIDIFGVQNPETGELGFVSVMGQMGEHYALALYLGAEGLSRFWALQTAGDDNLPDDLLNTPHLQASFEDREQLTDEDRAVIKGLGLRFRGRQAWPLFRSYRPGYLPWYLEPAEARLLTCAIEQVLEVAPRLKEAPDLLNTPDEDSYVVRVPRQETGGLVWKDVIVEVPPVEPEPVRITTEAEEIKAAHRLPRTRATLEADLFMMPGCIGERGERPFFVYDLMLVESISGFIVGSELLDPRPGLPAMWATVPPTLLRLLTAVRMLPAVIKVASPLLHQLLQPLGQQLGFDVKVASLPTLEQTKKDFLSMFSGSQRSSQGQASTPCQTCSPSKASSETRSVAPSRV